MSTSPARFIPNLLPLHEEGHTFFVLPIGQHVGSRSVCCRRVVTELRAACKALAPPLRLTWLKEKEKQALYRLEVSRVPCRPKSQIYYLLLDRA